MTFIKSPEGTHGGASHLSFNPSVVMHSERDNERGKIECQIGATKGNIGLSPPKIEARQWVGLYEGHL